MIDWCGEKERRESSTARATDYSTVKAQVTGDLSFTGTGLQRTVCTM